MEKKYTNLTETEWLMLKQYGGNFRIGSELENFDTVSRRFILRLMEIAYQKGREDKGRS